MLLPIRLIVLGPRSTGRGGSPRSVLILGAAIKVLRIDLDDIEIITQLPGLGRKAQVGDGGNGDGAELEAGRPVFVGLVLQLELERGVLEVGETCFGGLCGGPYSASLSFPQLIFFPGLYGTTHTEHPASSLALPSFAWS